MALMDSARPLLWIGALAASATAGFAVGYMVARDPAVVRRWARLLAGGVERGQLALAEAREHLADVWAEVREEARGEAEEAAFAQAAAAAAASTKRAARASSGARTRTRTAGATARRTRRRSSNGTAQAEGASTAG